MIQQELLKKLQQTLPSNTSIIEAVAEALDISYDAAHRRTSIKSKLSLEESVILARYYNLSLDSLFSIGNKNLITVEKTSVLCTETEIASYFQSSYKSLKKLTALKNSTLIYSAKDIPLFHTLNNQLLNRFKIYTWLKILNPNFNQKHFTEFHLKPNTAKISEKLGKIYNQFFITEIWDVTTINSTLKQIHFYYYAGLLSNSDSLTLCKELKSLISSVQNKVNQEEIDYNLYYNELLLMNNNVLIATDKLKTLFVPFKVLSYYKTSDINTCNEASLFFKQQLNNSKLLNKAGEKEQQIFFNKLYKKIDTLSRLLRAENELDFE